MVSVRFEQCDGRVDVIDVEAEASLMEGAVFGGINGIAAECGGQLSCATCHIFIEAPWRAMVPPPTEDECDLLDFVTGRAEGSRLACQVRVARELDGIIVRVPASQY